MSGNLFTKDFSFYFGLVLLKEMLLRIHLGLKFCYWHRYYLQKYVITADMKAAENCKGHGLVKVGETT